MVQYGKLRSEAENLIGCHTPPERNIRACKTGIGRLGLPSLYARIILPAKNRTWLPLLFFLVADLFATVLSWSLSDWATGPRVGVIDAGYHRTWYGILATLILWIIFWIVLIRLPIGRQERRQTPSIAPCEAWTQCGCWRTFIVQQNVSCPSCLFVK